MAAYADLCKGCFRNSEAAAQDKRIDRGHQLGNADEKSTEITTIISGFSAENLTKKVSKRISGNTAA